MFTCDYTCFEKKKLFFFVFFYGPPSPTYAHNLKTIHFWMSLKLPVEDSFFSAVEQEAIFSDSEERLLLFLLLRRGVADLLL